MAVRIVGGKESNAYYKELELLIKREGLTKRCFLKGITNNVKGVLEKGDIFAFPSAYEGFGMALAEGMSMGLPSVGFKNCPGVNELITDKQNGLLCDDGVDSFAGALETLMCDRAIRIKMGKEAHEAMKCYAPDAIWDKWEQLLKRLVEK